MKYALKRVKEADAAHLVANAGKLILLENRLRKTEETIAKKLRSLRKG